jgi:hypothetical protein
MNAVIGLRAVAGSAAIRPVELRLEDFASPRPLAPSETNGRKALDHARRIGLPAVRMVGESAFSTPFARRTEAFGSCRNVMIFAHVDPSCYRDEPFTAFMEQSSAGAPATDGAPRRLVGGNPGNGTSAGV